MADPGERDSVWDVRFTFRCFEEDLGKSRSDAPDDFSEVSHPLVSRAKDVLDHDGLQDRIGSIDDNVFLKVKPNNRWRGAVWVDLNNRNLAWLVSAGTRTEGSRDDFYEHLKLDCVRRRKDHNRVSQQPVTTDTLSDFFLPTADDYERLRVDEARRHLDSAREAISRSLKQARDHPDVPVCFKAFGCDLSLIVVENGIHELYVGVSVRARREEEVDVILSILVPDARDTDWQILPTQQSPFYEPPDVLYLTLLEVPRLHTAPEAPPRAEQHG